MVYRQGYTPTLNPKVGDLIGYVGGFLKETAITHYGLISKIEGDRIYVRSKWNQGYVFEHPFHFLPMGTGGSAYTFLTDSL
ncbi:MAG TPA: hypothetical protein VLE89_09055 [Chlamydiales bacterium]|nr:hypothetical protein [Chlamydiales bacterium]